MFIKGHKKGFLEGELLAPSLEDEITGRQMFQLRGLKCM